VLPAGPSVTAGLTFRLVSAAIPGCEDSIPVGMDADAVVLRAWQPAFQRHVAVHLHAGKSLSTSKRGLAGRPQNG
jgi:hypothetical protein